MRKYETIVVLQPNLSADGVKDEVKNIQTILETNGGKQVVPNVWGKKEISYIVKKHKQGVFVSYGFESDNSNIIDKLASLLRIGEQVLLFQTIKINERARKFKGRPRKGSSEDLYNDQFVDFADGDY